MPKILAILFCLTFWFFQEQATSEDPQRFQVWGVFHYYLNSKYFNELGYRDLYSCALEADAQDDNNFYDISTVRNLYNYQLVPREELPPCPIANFSKARWYEFRDDIDYFSNLAYIEYYEGVFVDKGFNAPPFWVAATSFISNAFSVRNPIASHIFFNLDVLFVLGSLAIIWRHMGNKLALGCGLLALFCFCNMRLIGGNYVQHLWFPALTLAIYYWNRQRAALSGCFLGISACLQAFPLIFSFPIIGSAFLYLHTRSKQNKAALTFTFAFILSVMACVALGSFSNQGMWAWLEWYKKISLHRNYVPAEVFNIGFSNMLGLYIADIPQISPETYIEDFSYTITRLQNLKNVQWVIHLNNLIMFFIVFLWLYRTKKPAFFGLGYLFVFSLVSLSAYYYLMLALIPYAFVNAPILVKRVANLGLIYLMLFNLVLFPLDYINFNYKLHLLSLISVTMYIWAIALAVFYDAVRKKNGRN